jgi:hypothetical protein
MQNVVISAMSTARDPSLGKPTETFTLNAGAIRFGDPEPPAATGETTAWWPGHPRIGQ